MITTTEAPAPVQATEIPNETAAVRRFGQTVTVDKPEFPAAERIEVGAMEIVLEFFLFAALVVFCSIH
jgi:hypothetical protein